MRPFAQTSAFSCVRPEVTMTEARDPNHASLAEALDAVQWDHEGDDEPSPLEPTYRYFAEFPWDGED